MLGDTWTDTENAWQHRQLWRRLWLSKRSERDAVMHDEERSHLASLPDRFTIYRGVTRRRAFRGLSWTLDCQKAQWFNNLYRTIDPHKGDVVLEAEISKADALAYFDCRNEQEIVVNPRALRDLQITSSDAPPIGRTGRSWWTSRG